MESEPEIHATELVKRIKVIDAVFLLSAAWNLVKPETISNCWKKCFSFEHDAESQTME